MPGSASALLDSRTNIALAVSPHPPTIIFLNECMPDTVVVHNTHYPNYRWQFFFPSGAPEEYVRWTWNWKTRIFEKTNPKLITQEIRDRSKLAVAKRNAIFVIMLYLTHVRYKIGTGVEFQETVYMTKKLQAQSFRDSGYDEKKVLEYPYVLQYADFAGIPLRQAADDILLKAKFDDQLLAKTELLRLKYFNKVREANNPGDLPAIYEEFLLDYYYNAKV